MAVRPPEEVLAAVERAVAPARRSMVGPRWASRDQWHLTLQFLGPVEALDPLVGALSVLRGRGSFDFRLGGGGAFPTLRRARVIWIGATEGAEGMCELAAAVGVGLAPLGYEADRGRFRPHVTVARLRTPGDVHPAVEALGADPVGPGWTVGEVLLYESRLSPKGSTYRVLECIPLEE